MKLRAEGKAYKPSKKPKQPAAFAGTDTDAQQAQTAKKSRNGSAKHHAQHPQQQQPWDEEMGSRPEEEVQVSVIDQSARFSAAWKRRLWLRSM